VANSEAVLLSRAPYGKTPDSEIVCLLDTGASANLIRKDSPLVAVAKVYKHPREKKIILADGSCSDLATVDTFMFADLKLVGNVPTFRLRFDITAIGRSEVVLGVPFFEELMCCQYVVPHLLGRVHVLNYVLEHLYHRQRMVTVLSGVKHKVKTMEVTRASNAR
jgi:hypothetical protein